MGSFLDAMADAFNGGGFGDVVASILFAPIVILMAGLFFLPFRIAWWLLKKLGAWLDARPIPQHDEIDALESSDPTNHPRDP